LDVKQAVDRLRSMGDPKAVEGMARFGIQSGNSFGVLFPSSELLPEKLDAIINWHWNCGRLGCTMRDS